MLLIYKIGIAAGLNSIREMAALFSPHGYYLKDGKVTRLSSQRTQPTDSRLSETNMPTKQGFMQDQIIASHTCFGGHIDVNC